MLRDMKIAFAVGLFLRLSVSAFFSFFPTLS